MNEDHFNEIKNYYIKIGLQFEKFSDEARIKGTLPENLWTRLGKEKLFEYSVRYQNEDGLAYLAAALLGLSYGMRDPSPCSSIISQAGVVMPVIENYSTAEFKNQYWQSLLDGKRVVAQAGTELHGGSEARLMETTLTPYDNGYHLNGIKWSITNAPIADLMLVTAHVENTHNSVICAVDTSWTGVDLSHKLCAAGVENSPTGQVKFSNVFVPMHCIMGKIGEGISILNTIFLRERLLLGFLYAGVMERIIDEVMERADSRKVFSKRIIEYQYIRRRLTDIQCCHEITQLLAHHALKKFMSGKECSLEASLSKFYGANLAVKAVLNAVKIFGSYGVQKGKFDHLVLSSIAASIGGGTEEIQREEILQNMYRSYRNKHSKNRQK